MISIPFSLSYLSDVVGQILSEPGAFLGAGAFVLQSLLISSVKLKKCYSTAVH